MRDPFLKCRRLWGSHMLPLISQHCTLTPPLYGATTKQDRQPVWVWGTTEQQELLWGWTWRHPDFICSFSILRLWKFFLLTCFVPLSLEKCIGFMEGASKSHLTLLTSQHCFTREVSANIYNKIFFTLVQPMILLFFSCCDKGSSHRWPFELGREEAEKPVRKKN